MCPNSKVFYLSMWREIFTSHMPKAAKAKPGRLKPGSWNSVWTSHTGCLKGVHYSKKLEQKYSGQDYTKHSLCGRSVFSKARLNQPLPHAPPKTAFVTGCFTLIHLPVLGEFWREWQQNARSSTGFIVILHSPRHIAGNWIGSWDSNLPPHGMLVLVAILPAMPQHWLHECFRLGEPRNLVLKCSKV